MRRSARTRRPLGLRSGGTAAACRHLQVPGGDGQVEAIGDASGETLCQRCGTDAHHHHLTCRNCGHSVEVEGPGRGALGRAGGGRACFIDVGHTVQLFGLCPGSERP